MAKSCLNIKYPEYSQDIEQYAETHEESGEQQHSDHHEHFEENTLEVSSNENCQVSTDPEANVENDTNSELQLEVINEILNLNHKAKMITTEISQMNTVLSSDHLYNNITNIYELQKEHENIDENMKILDKKVEIFKTYVQFFLKDYDANITQELTVSMSELNKLWESVIAKSHERIAKLDERYYIEHFLVDYKNLSSTINNMGTILTTEKIPHDTILSEAIIKRHQELKAAFEKCEEAVDSVIIAADRLIKRGYYMPSQISHKLDVLAENELLLLSLWEKRQALYDEACSSSL